MMRDATVPVLQNGRLPQSRPSGRFVYILGKQTGPESNTFTIITTGYSQQWLNRPQGSCLILTKKKIIQHLPFYRVQKKLHTFMRTLGSDMFPTVSFI